MLLMESRRFFGSMLCDKKHTVVSFDDDKQRMRSNKCMEELFVRQRHSDAGGFGPVQHVAVSQLTHFVLGGIVNSVNSTDAASVQTILRDLDPEAQNQDDVNLEPLIFAFDRGHQKEAISRKFKAAKVSEFGTIMRQKSIADFPYTCGHPESAINVPEEGVPLGMWSVRGTTGKEELAHCTRTCKGKVILMKTTLSHWKVPVGGPFVPPPLEVGTAPRTSTPGSSSSTPLSSSNPAPLLDLTNGFFAPQHDNSDASESNDSDCSDELHVGSVNSHHSSDDGWETCSVDSMECSEILRPPTDAELDGQDVVEESLAHSCN